VTANRSSNRLLNGLSDQDYDLISTGLEEVDLPHGFHLATAGQSFNHVYFPCNGIASVIAVSPRGRRAEAGMVGREGFTPIGGLVKASEGPFDIVIQVAGHGVRLKLTALHGPVNSSPAMRDLLLRYLVAFNHQVAFTALSNAAHTIDVRLARWILMSQDRMQSSQIALTHDYLSLMLAVEGPRSRLRCTCWRGNVLFDQSALWLWCGIEAVLKTMPGTHMALPSESTIV